MDSPIRRARWVAAAAGGISIALAATGCSGPTDASDPAQSDGVTITVAMSADPPPKSAMDAFTKDTGITVEWSNVDWDSLQTKITAAGTANTYFADVTNVDWSRVGQLGKLGWFQPLESYVDTEELGADMPQMSSFVVDGDTIGVPYTASFHITVVNRDMFDEAGITEMPTTIDQYTKDLVQIKDAGVVDAPLSIPFAAAEALSTYWYQATAAFGGTILDGNGEPQFGGTSSAGYLAAEWMVDALNNGLVPADNINVGGNEGVALVANATVATNFADYAGIVGGYYDLPDSSQVVDQIEYLPVPGIKGIAPMLNLPDGIGIPTTAKQPAAAGEFIEWLTSAESQAAFAGAKGADGIWEGYGIPSRLSAVNELNDAGNLAGGDALIAILESETRAVFPDGAPTWYPEFSRSVYTSLHAAAVGDMSVKEAISTMASTATNLATGQ